MLKNNSLLRSRVAAVLIAALVLASAAQSALAQTYVPTNVNGSPHTGVWEDPLAWSPNSPVGGPGPSDTVVIGSTTTYDPQMSMALSHSIANLTFSGDGNTRITAGVGATVNLTVTGTFNFSGGLVYSQANSSTTVTIPVGATLNLQCTSVAPNGASQGTTGIPGLNAATLSISGTVNYNATDGYFNVGSAAQINILSGALYDIQSVTTSAQLDINNGSSPSSTITNAGTLRMSASGTAHVGILVVNTGTIDASGGKLVLSCGGGVIVTTLNDGTVIKGTGLTFQNLGTLQMNGTTTVNSPDSFEFPPGVTMNGSGTSIVAGTGTMNWTGGAMIGTGTTTISQSITLAVNCGANTPGMNGWILNLAGKMTYNATSGYFNSASAAQINILPGALLDIQSATSSTPQTDFNNGGGNPSTISNAGTLRMSGSGTAHIGNLVVNTGTIDASGGKLVLSCGGGVVITTLNDGTVIKGTGLTFQNLGTLLMNGTTTVNSPDSFEFPPGVTMNGSGTSIVAGTGTLNWTGGAMIGTGKTTISQATTLAVNCGANIPGMNGWTLIVAGKMTYNATSGYFNTANAAQINILSGALLDIQSATSSAQTDFNNGGGTLSTISNAGTLRKSGTGSARVCQNIVNAGTIDASGGKLQLGTGSANATVLLNDGGVIKGSGLVFNQAEVQMTGTTTVNAPDSFELTTGGTLDGTGTGILAGTGTMNWTGGTIGGANGDKTTISAATTLAINCGTNVPILTFRTLEIAGTATYNTTTGFLNTGNAAQINILSGGSLDIQSANTNGGSDFNNGGGPLATVSNAGTLKRTGAAGTALIGINATNSGSLEALAGTLSFAFGLTQSAGTTLLNGGNLAATTLTINGGTLVGAGTITGNVVNSATVAPGNSGPGLLNITGNYTQNASGTLTAELNGLTAGTQYDQLAVTGTATLGGTLTATYLNNFVPAAGSTFDVLTFASKTGTFATIPTNLNPPLTVGQNATQVRLSAGALILPSFTSGPTVTPNPALKNQTVTFTASATISNGAQLFFLWQFGDGASDASGAASVTHTYSTAGVFNGAVFVSDGTHPAVSLPLTVTVNPPLGLVGSGPDNDGDGFSDAFETAVGTNPNDPASTPVGKAITQADIQTLTISKVSIKLNFAAANKDLITFSGTVPVPAGFNPANAKVYFDIGGVAKVLTLTSKASVKSGNDSAKFAIKATKGVVKAQTSKFGAGFKNGAFAAALADEGLTGAATVKNVSKTVVFTLIFNNTVMQKTQTVSYTATKGKSGSAK
ncbi:MAG TPA: PKD domain-containing protein [Planctomycetota bacterium]|nr:PKD domain-containing protein [Planctomycetota bacterium]